MKRFSLDLTVHQLNPEILKIIQRDFSPEEQERVERELLSIELNHVMAESQWNLDNTLNAILFLAKGDLEKVIGLTKSAKIDFRDVIYWAWLERKEESEK